ncbi:hypothetical protein ABZ876_30755 [Streptomyces sp. NPDC046931]|uniref:hypothetical protein n=1 Tax=Streptomyces sp. NPDC046931 TaxID=3154806 RepID=UPI0034066F40
MLAPAVAALVEERLADLVLAPFCGTGSFLWAALGSAAEREAVVDFLGYELDAQIAALAAGIGQGAPRHVVIEKGDSFRREFAAPDVVITAPPLGLSLSDRRLLLNGSTTSAGDTAAVATRVPTTDPGGGL